MNTEPLIELFKDCVVWIKLANDSGTGFFVAPGRVLTCEHVVRSAQGEKPIFVYWHGQKYQAHRERSIAGPYPDLALLRVEGIDTNHPCVWLHEDVLVKEQDQLHGYSAVEEYQAGTPTLFSYTGSTGGENPLLTLKGDQVEPGFSGSPLLNLRTGGVCGMIRVSRDLDFPAGGRAIPTATILRFLSELVDMQREFHARDQRWQQARREQSSMSPAAGVDLDEIAEQYRRALLGSPQMTQITVSGMDAPLALDTISIRLRLSRRERQRTWRAQEDEPPALSDPFAFHEHRQKLLEQRFSSSFEPVQALRQYRRCVFLGEPGAGKTTLLKYLAGQFLQQKPGDFALVPIFIPLSDCVHAQVPDLLTFAVTSLSKRFALDESNLRAYFNTLIGRHQALFLLDALDEVASGAGPQESEQEYNRVIAAIEELAERCEYMVMTARRAGYHQRPVPGAFTELEVLNFRWPEIEQFIDQWFRLRLPAGWQTSAEAFKTRLLQNASILTLAANPLLLTQLALLFEDTGDLPDRRSTIYQQCIELMQRKWDSQRRVTRARSLGVEEEIHLLRELAWHLHCQRRHALPAEACQHLIAQFLPAFNRDDLTPTQVLQELSSDRGLLREQDDRHYAFVHHTFQEYFAAQYVKEVQAEATLLASLGDPWWEEVLLLYAGAVHDASSLLTHLLAPRGPREIPEDIFLSKLILAGRCLAEHATIHTPDLRQRVIERLLTELNAAEFQFTRKHLAETLAEIGRARRGERVQDDSPNRELLAFLQQSPGPFSPSLELQRCVLQALGTSGSPALAAALFDLFSQPASENRADLWLALEEALEHLAQPDDVFARRLLALAQDPQTGERLASSAAYLLAWVSEPAQARTLLAALQTDNLSESVRGGLVFSCALLGDVATITDLLALLMRDPGEHAFLLTALWETLARRHDPDVLPILLPLLSSKELDAYLRSSLALTLLRSGSPSVADTLAPLVTDASLDREVRLACARVFGALGVYRYQDELLRLISDQEGDEQVRCSLVLGLAEAPDKALRARLFDLYKNESSPVLRQALVITLGVLGEPAVIHDLQILWETDQLPFAGLRPRVTEVLARELNASTCASLLRSASIDASTRAEFARALGKLGRRNELLPLLVTLIEDNVIQESVREACAEAMGELGKTRADAEHAHQLLLAYKYHQTYPSYRNSPVVDTLFRALWRISRRAGLLVLPSLAPDAAPYAYRLVERGSALS